MVNEYKSNDICPKCSKLLDDDGLCWHCLTIQNKNKLDENSGVCITKTS
jgi:hypothetical protein